MRIIPLIVLIAAIWSCQGPSGERAVTGDAASSNIADNYVTFAADIDNSVVEWVGARPASQHNGTAGLKDGHLKISDGEIVGGVFEIDLENIVVLDIDDPARNARLKRHLESDDFFDVQNHPKAVFEITGVDNLESAQNETTHRITGNLLMRGVTRSVTFDAAVEVLEDKVKARSGKFVIDRTEWGVNHESKTVFANLVDRFILDDIALVINLTAYRQ
jgi:hypothetical protein